jgi:hypothetical protein
LGQARDFTQKALAEVERGWRAAMARIGKASGLYNEAEEAEIMLLMRRQLENAGVEQWSERRPMQKRMPPLAMPSEARELRQR